jgi:putative methyltransferase (TIGR04325 family)
MTLEFAKTKALARDLCPPLLRRWRRRSREDLFWSGDFPSWEAAAGHCPGYGQAGILERVERSARRVQAGEGAYERDSVVFAEADFSWPLLSVLLHVAARNRGRLHVLDFGGSLGSTYQQHRAWLQDLPEVRWNVVEQEHFVRSGREHFADGHLGFHFSIAAAMASARPDVALFSSVLAYLPHPEPVLAEVAAAGVPYLLIDRTGFTRDDRERITIQRVPPSIYAGAYPCRFFSRTALTRLLSRNYDLVCAFPALDRPISFADFQGLFFRHRQRPPT